MRIKMLILSTFLGIFLIHCLATAKEVKKEGLDPNSILQAEKFFHDGRQSLFQEEYNSAIDLLKKAVENE